MSIPEKGDLLGPGHWYNFSFELELSSTTETAKMPALQYMYQYSYSNLGTNYYFLRCFPIDAIMITVHHGTLAWLSNPLFIECRDWLQWSNQNVQSLRFL